MKPKIIISVDNHSWCWRKTMEDLAYHLSGYDIDIVNAREFKKMKDYTDYLFVFMRGYANAFIDRNNKNKMIPFISTLSTGGNNLKMRMAEMNDIAKLGHAVVVQNKTAYHECKKAQYKNVYIIPNGVNTIIYSPAQEKPRIPFIGCAANTKDERAHLKGTGYVIGACRELNLNYVEANSENPLSYEQMADWYRALTIYAQPSDSEGCSNSVMEAMSSGLVCLICEGVGYHGEICRDGINDASGEVVFVKRDIKDIKEKMGLLIKDKRLYQRISNNARKFAEDHDWKYISRKYKQIFDEFTPIAKQQKIEMMNRPQILSEKTYNISSNRQERVVELSKIVSQFLKNTGGEKNTQNIIKVLEMFGYLSIPTREIEKEGNQNDQDSK